MSISVAANEIKVVTLDDKEAPNCGASFTVRAMRKLDWSGIKLQASRVASEEDGFANYAKSILRKGVVSFEGMQDDEGNAIEFKTDGKDRMLEEVINALPEATIYRMIAAVQEFNTVEGKELKK